MPRKLIVTIADGDEYRFLFETFALPTWRAYADRIGADIRVATSAELGRTTDSRIGIPWYKLLALSDDASLAYDLVCWIDADVLINHHSAPDIFDYAVPGRVGVVNLTHHFRGSEYDFERRTRYLQLNKYFSSAPPELRQQVRDGQLAYDLTRESFDAAIGPGNREIYNTGVILCEPGPNRALFREVFHLAETVPATRSYEQPALNEALLSAGVDAILPPRFNLILAWELSARCPFVFAPGFADFPKREALLGYFASSIFFDSYFLHFAEGYFQAVRLVDTASRTLVQHLERLR
ncbi:MAG: hypothetical protein FJX54_02525 [Alphaproteobacteria bacterium]|nr:hypothetical protein [Alphaproteobacteria bacterium]